MVGKIRGKLESIKASLHRRAQRRRNAANIIDFKKNGSVMKSRKIGLTDLTSTQLSYGCMRIAGTWNPKDVTPEREAAGKAAVIAAFEVGFTLFDHADIYCAGQGERIFGLALKDVPGMRERVIIATKCGIRFPGDPNPDSPHRFDFSRSHILQSCDKSLQRLGVQQIDIYQLHRPDFLMDPDEVAGAFDELKRSGKVKHFGVSNFSPSYVQLLASRWKEPLVVNQVEIHLGRLACFEDGTLDQCIEKHITPLSWSPLGGGFLGDGGKVPENHPRRETLQKLLTLMDSMAQQYAVSRTNLALAWLLKHPSGIIPIIGTTKPERIKDAVQADAVDMTREDWYRLLVAARGANLP